MPPLASNLAQLGRARCELVRKPGPLSYVIFLILGGPCRATMSCCAGLEFSDTCRGRIITNMPASARRVDFAKGYQVRLRAALNGGDGRLMTLSEGGAYIATPLALLPQAQLHIAI